MANKRAKKQTLAEFRAWLAGVEELQPDTWCPDETQWALIRGKINNIIEPKAPATDEKALQQLVEAMRTGMPLNGTPTRPGGAQNQHFQPPAHLPPPAPPVGGVPAGPVEISPEASAYQPPATPAPSIDLGDVAKPRDTGDGKYSSGFV